MTTPSPTRECSAWRRNTGPWKFAGARSEFQRRPASPYITRSREDRASASFPYSHLRGSRRLCEGSPRTGHTRGDAHRLLHAARVGPILTGNIERSPMVYRRPDDRNSQRDIYRAFEIDQLHGNVSLIVVHGDHEVECAARRLQEDGIGR